MCVQEECEKGGTDGGGVCVGEREERGYLRVERRKTKGGERIAGRENVSERKGEEREEVLH